MEGRRKMTNSAYFIGPDGSIYPVDNGKHIREIIASPETYGLTLGKIKAVFKKYDEPLGDEKYAREKIIGKLLEKGWTRVRLENGYLKFQIAKLTADARKNILKFLEKVKKGAVQPENRTANQIGIKVIFDKDNNFLMEDDIDIAIKALRNTAKE